MPQPADPLTATECFLRDRALAYPETVEAFPWGHRAIKVKKKIFLILDHTNSVISVTMKLPDSSAYALLQPYAKPTGYGLSKSGWVTCRFNHNDDPPLDLLDEWLEESYRAVAPKKLVLLLNARQAGDPEPLPLRPKRGPKKRKKG